MGAGDAGLPFPVYGAAFRVYFPTLDADGDPVAPGTPDTEISKDGGTFADCTNEATPIKEVGGSVDSGLCYIDLLYTEMQANAVVLQSKSTTAKATPIVLYPRRLPSIRTGTASGGAAGYITLEVGAPATDDIFKAVIVQITGGTGAGQARVVTTYTGTNRQAGVAPAWGVNPSSDSTYTMLLTDMAVNILLGAVAGSLTAQQVWEYGTRGLTDKAGFSVAGTKQTLDALNDITAAAPWSAGSRSLTDKAGFTISGTKQTLDALNDITAASIWSVGARTLTSFGSLAADVWAVTTRALTDKAGFALSSTGVSAIWDEICEGTWTFRKLFRVLFACTYGKSSGGSTANPKFRDVGDTKDRVDATVDANGNRTNVNLNGD